MSDIVLTIGPGHTLREASRLMVERGIGSAVVLDDEAPGPRILSERDVLVSIGRGEDPDTEKVGDHMSDTVITATPDWSLERAAAEMAHRNIRHLVIVSGGELAGVLSMRDIMRVWASDGATSEMPVVGSGS